MALIVTQARKRRKESYGIPVEAERIENPEPGGLGKKRINLYGFFGLASPAKYRNLPDWSLRDSTA